MRLFVPFVLSLCATASALHAEESPAPQQQDAAPRWQLLGEDADLRRTIAESDHVLLVCVYQTALENVNPPFAEVVLSATTVESLKGTHATGDKIALRFHSDSLPSQADERAQFIDSAARKNLGSLKLAFLRGEKSAAHSCEWLDLAPYSPEMIDFVHKNLKAMQEPSSPDKPDR
jgi:hypothetical protein